MIQHYILTLIGEDKPGLVQKLAEVIKSHSGNWEESRLANLRGKFSGIVVVSIPEQSAGDFETSVGQLAEQGLSIRAHQTELSARPSIKTRMLEVVANDRPDILREVTSVLSRLGVNVEDLNTNCEPAPMSNELLFRAKAHISIPEGLSEDQIAEALEELADDLMVELQTS
jgi:glycine cleavage system regulatory protein